MNVGREMDALVAERVMGLRVERVARAWTLEDWWCSDSPSERDCLGIPNPEFRPGAEHPPAYAIEFYSTDIAAAYRVMQKLGLALVPQSTDSGFAWLACDLEAVRYGAAGITLVPHWPTAISAPTAPEAVCRAALASVGVRE